MKYIYLELIKSSIIHFTNKTFIKHIYDKQAIDIWEAAINQNKQIFVFAEEETVNDLPNHYATKNKDKTFKTTLNVLILCDENKNRLEDPRKIAEDLLLRSGYFTLMK